MLQRQAEANGHDAGACEPSLSGVEIKLSWQVGSTASQCPLKTFPGRREESRGEACSSRGGPLLHFTSWLLLARSCWLVPPGCFFKQCHLRVAKEKKEKRKKKAHTKVMGTTNSPRGDTPRGSVLCWFKFFSFSLSATFQHFYSKKMCVGCGATELPHIHLRNIIPLSTHTHMQVCQMKAFWKAPLTPPADRQIHLPLVFLPPTQCFLSLDCPSPPLQLRSTLVNNWGIFPLCYCSFPAWIFIIFFGAYFGCHQYFGFWWGLQMLRTHFDIRDDVHWPCSLCTRRVHAAKINENSFHHQLEDHIFPFLIFDPLHLVLISFWGELSLTSPAGTV